MLKAMNSDPLLLPFTSGVELVLRSGDNTSTHGGGGVWLNQENPEVYIRREWGPARVRGLIPPQKRPEET